MKHITVLFDDGGTAIAAHHSEDAVKVYKLQLEKENPSSTYEIQTFKYKDVIKAMCFDDIYLVSVGNNWVPSCHMRAYNELVGDSVSSYEDAVQAIYRFVETTDTKLKDKDIKALTKVICLLNGEIERIGGEPIDSCMLEEVSQNLRDLNWQVADD